MTRKSIFVTMTAAMVVACMATTSPAGDWQVEITPYAWLAGIDADVTAGGRTAEVDVGFDDLIDKVDLAAAIMVTAQKDQLVLWGQFDYMSLNESGKTSAGASAEVDADTTFLAGGVGWHFLGGLTEDATTDVLVGVRSLSLETEISVSGAGSVDADTDIVDVIVIVRPSIPINDKWRFNPTLSIGAGDSDLVWELQPHLQYQFNETLAGRIGYRRLHYEIEGDRAEFDGAFHGLILGLGATL